MLLALSACGHEVTQQQVGDAERRERLVRFWDDVRAATDARIGGDMERAAGLYGKALAFDPRHEDSLYYLGHCNQELANYTEARAAFERLLEVNPVSARGHAALGALLASPEPAAPLDLDVARRHLAEAHRINVEETGPMVRLGEVLLVQGDLEAAARMLEDASHTNPRSVEAAFLAGYLRFGARDDEGARRFLARARAALADGATPPPPQAAPGEGDTRSGTKPARPHARTLLADAVRAGLGSAAGTEPELAEQFAPVTAAMASLVARAGASPGVDQ